VDPGLAGGSFKDALAKLKTGFFHDPAVNFRVVYTGNLEVCSFALHVLGSLGSSGCPRVYRLAPEARVDLDGLTKVRPDNFKQLGDLCKGLDESLSFFPVLDLQRSLTRVGHLFEGDVRGEVHGELLREGSKPQG